MRTRLVPILSALAALSALAVALSSALPARASVAEALELRDLVHESDEIVLGVTQQTAARYDGEHIVTDSVVLVQERMRGGSERELLVTTLGGAVGEIGMRVEGAAHLSAGARAVLFLRRGRAGRLIPVGMAQGVLPVETDARGNELVHPGGRGLALMQRIHGGRLAAAPGALMAPRPLADVWDELAALVAADESP